MKHTTTKVLKKRPHYDKQPKRSKSHQDLNDNYPPTIASLFCFLLQEIFILVLFQGKGDGGILCLIRPIVDRRHHRSVQFEQSLFEKSVSVFVQLDRFRLLTLLFKLDALTDQWFRTITLICLTSSSGMKKTYSCWSLSRTYSALLS